MQAPSHSQSPPVASGSVSPDEIARFGALAARWWDLDGPMRPLHRMNRMRVDWIFRQLALQPNGPGRRRQILDVGCGAGIASEALAAKGADVLGVDASSDAIMAAETHRALATAQNPAAGRLTYRCASAETLVAEKQCFDMVVALEVIEHVTDAADFLALLADLVSPGGMIVISTLNRTRWSLATAKIAAEYIVRMLPRGTHDWRKFVTPAELRRFGGQAGLRVSDCVGMTLGARGWRESRDLSVNYIACLIKDPD